MVTTTKVKWGELCSIATPLAAIAWIQAMHTNLLACGLIQTSDAGQLDISSISAIPAAGSYFGSLIYKFNDSLASSKPVIIKMRPYVGSYGGQNSAGLSIQIGFATDGLGNITGSATEEFNVFNSTFGTVRAEVSAPTPCFAIHGEGYFGALLHLGRLAAVPGVGTGKAFPLCYVGITRTVDADDNPTADGVFIARNPLAYESNTTIGSIGMRLSKARLNSAMSAWRQDLSPWVGGGEAASANGRTQIQRTYRMTPSVDEDPAIAMYWGSSIPTGDEFEIAVDGKARHYLAIGANAGLVADSVNTNLVGFAMLWGDL